MQNERLLKLFSMEKEEKDSPLIVYMIALELKNIDTIQCEKYFDKLLSQFPEYLASYYMAGEFFYENDKFEKSATIIQKGIDLAKEQNNQKTWQELKNLLVNVEMEM